MSAHDDRASAHRVASSKPVGFGSWKHFHSRLAPYAPLFLVAACLAGFLCSARANDVVDVGPKIYPTGTWRLPAVAAASTLSTSDTVVVPNGAAVTYVATTQIRLEPGFSVTGGGAVRIKVSALPVPDGLRVANVGPQSFTVQWNAPSADIGAASYEVRLDGTSLGTVFSPLKEITGLNPASTYSVAVRVSDANGNWSDWCAPLGVATLSDTTPPSVPTSLSATSLNGSSFTLNWSSSTDGIGVTGYEIRVDGVSIGTFTDTSHLLAGLNPNTRYAVQVRARDSAGNWSPWSDTLTVVTPAGVLTLTGESNFTYDDGGWGHYKQYTNLTGVALVVHSRYTHTFSDNAFGQNFSQDSQWTVPAGGGYNETYNFDVFSDHTEQRIVSLLGVETLGVPAVTGATVHTSAVGVLDTLALTASNSPTSFTASGLPPGLALDSAGAISGTPTTAGTYRVAIGATNSYGTGSATLVWTVIVDSEAPTSPGTPYLSNLQNAPDFTLNWTASTDNMGVTAYEVLKNGTGIGTYAGNTGTISFAYPDTDYVVAIRARDASGNWSAPSAPLTVHTYGISVVGGTVTPAVAIPGSRHQVAITEPLPVGKYFAGWTVTGAGTIDNLVMPMTAFTAGATDTVINATYADGYQVVPVDAPEAKGMTLSAAGGAAGQTIALHAPPEPSGFYFAGWKLDGPGMIYKVQEGEATLTLGPARTIVTPTYRQVLPRQIFSTQSLPEDADVNVPFSFGIWVYRNDVLTNAFLRLDYSLDGGVSWNLGDNAHGTAWNGNPPEEFHGYFSYSQNITMSFDRPGIVLYRTRGWSEDEPEVPGLYYYAKVPVSQAGALGWVPTNVRVEGLESTDTWLRWDPAVGAPANLTYEIYVIGGGFDGTIGTTGTDTSTRLVFLKPDTTYTFKVRARNWTDSSAWSAPLTITSLNMPILTSPPTANGLVGVPFDFHLVATNQPTSFSVTGTLPPGLSFNSATGVISGTPTATGYWTLATSAMNRSGPGYGSLFISIATLPSIQTQPASQAVVAGQAVSFSVAASGTPTPTYQWNKNGIPISGAMSSTLSLTSVTAGDTGYYTVTVTNAGGSVTSQTAVLSVVTDVAPTIVEQPASIKTVAGQAVGFSVRASGLPAPTYQWKKNGSAIAGATANTYSISSTATADAGDYTVTVSNASGSVSSSVATLTVAAVNTAPTVTWTQVPDGTTTLHPGDPFVMRAQGQDAEGNLASVTIWRVVSGSDVTFATAGPGDGSSSTTPIVSASGTAAGTITFKAQATDASGASSAIITRDVTITAADQVANVAPTIYWTQGPSTAWINANFAVQAHAEDANGNLTNVQIWQDGQAVQDSGAGNGSRNDSPAIVYSQASTGSVTFHAKAIDAAGAQSPTIDLSVAITNVAPIVESVRDPVAVRSGDLVGTLSGSLSVDNKGTASYSIALPTAPGRAGLQPSLALSYNSAGGNGPLGIGWSISTGFPQAITRGRTLLARDGIVAGPNFTPDFARLYLDGRRLVQAAPAGADYWSIGTSYRTEVDSFVTITSGGSGATDALSNPVLDRFTVAGKDGTTTVFGAIDGATDAIDYAPPAASYGLIRSWAIKQVTDAVGNQLVFAYTNYTDAAGKLTGEQHLESITYTSNPGASVSADSRIRFLYSPEDPDNPAVRPDAMKSAMLGGSELRRRLSKIEVDVRTNGTWETIRRYGLNYETAAKSGLSRLRYVVSAWKDAPGGTWKSIPSTELTYKDDPSPVPVFKPTGQLSAHGTGDRAVTAAGDFNGDGKTDRFANGEVFLSDGDGFTDGQQWIDLAAISGGWVEFVKVGDFDGDGKSDIMWMGASSTEVYVARSNGHGFEPLSGPGGSYVAVSASQAWFDTGVISMPKGTRASRVSVGDFDGDGRSDVLIHTAGDRLSSPNGIYVALSHGNGFDAVTKWGNTNFADAMYMFTSIDPVKDVTDPQKVLNTLEYAAIEPIVADFNGDGVDDYAWVCRRTFTNPVLQLHPSFSSTYIALDISVNFVISQPWSPRKFSDPNGIHWQTNDGHNPEITAADYILSCIPADVDGDGLTDLLVLGKDKPGATGQTQWILYRNNGYGPLERIEKYLPVAEWVGDTYVPTYNQDYQQTLSETVNLASVTDETVERTTSWFVDSKSGAFLGWGEATETLYEGDTRYWIAPSYSTDEREQSGGMFLVDINHDGRADYVWGTDVGNAEGWWVKYGTTDGFGPAQKLWALSDLDFGYGYSPYTRMDTREGGVSLEAIDIDGDGVQDFLFTARQNEDSYFGPILAKVPGPHADRLVAVHDGLGSDTSLAYATVANPAIYTPGVDVSYPIRERRGGQHVVAEVWRDSGGANPAHFSYQYSGNRFDLSGRGPLGFHSFVTFDHQTNLFKYQFLTQSFPMTGLTAREETYRYLGSGDFHLLSSHDNTVVFDEVVKGPNDSTPWGTVYPFVSRAIESRWENSDHPDFSLGEATQSSQSETLFKQTKPSDPHITITATSLFDGQTAAQTTLPDVAAGNGKFYASDTAAGSTNNVTGVTSYSAIQGLGLPRAIYYGNLVQLATDYGDGFTEKVVTEYKSPVGAMTGLVGNVTTTVTAPGYDSQTAPVKRYTYFGSTPLVETETIDSSDDSLDLKTTYTRDSLGRVTDTTISNTTATGVQAIGTYSVGNASVFDAYFDLPTTIANAAPYLHTTTTEYHRIFAKPTSVTDVNGAQATTVYDALGRVTNVTDVLKGLSTDTAFAWTLSSASDWKKAQVVMPPSSGVVDAVTLSSVYATRTTATVQPPVTAYFDRLGRTIRIVKEGFNDQKTVTDTVYDTLGRVVAVSLPYASGTAPLWTKTSYDSLGRVSIVTAPNGTVTTTTYNGRATSVTVDAPNLGGADPAAQTNTTVVNAKGQTIKVWNADNVPTFSDTKGTAATYVIPSIEFTLDGFGRMRKTTLKGQTQTITADYDDLGHQTSLNDPDKGPWSYVNNALGQVVQQTDANQNVTITAFDHLGRTLSRATVEPSSGPTELADYFYYDTADTAATDPALHLVPKGTQGWIGALQRTEASTTSAPGYAGANSATATAHYYDAKGRPITDLTTIDGKWFYTYTSYAEPDGSDYSRVNQVRHYWLPGGAEDQTQTPSAWQDFGYTYSYDSKSYLLSLADTTSSPRTWWQVDPSTGYDYLDRPVLVQKGNAYWTKRTYRPEDGVIASIATGTTQGATGIQNLAFTFDGLGNLRKRTSGSLTEDLDYDILNRLKSDKQGTISYFDNGNIKNKTGVAGDTTSDYVYSASKPHAVSTAFGYTMGYDANGNLTSRSKGTESWILKYAGFDKPRWMTKFGATTVGSEFLYDANRSRTVQLEYDQANATTGEPTHYLRKRIYGLGPTLEANYGASYPNGTLTWMLNKVRIYVPGPDGVIGAREFDNPTSSGGTEKALVYHYDHLGSIQGITPFGSTDGSYASDTGGKAGQFSENAWGQRRNPLTWSGSPTTTDDGGADSLTPRGFTGHEMLDDLGLIHMNGRIYDPLLGRFISADSKVPGFSDLQSYNRYAYVLNNPLRFTDPDGKAQKDAAAGAIEGANNALVDSGPFAQSFEANSNEAAQNYGIAGIMRFFGFARAVGYFERQARNAESRADLAQAIMAAQKANGSAFASRVTGSNDINHPHRVIARNVTEVAVGAGVPALEGVVADHLSSQTITNRRTQQNTTTPHDVEPSTPKRVDVVFRGIAGKGEVRAADAFQNGLPPHGGPNAEPTTENLIASINVSSKASNSAYTQASESREVATGFATNSGSRGGVVFEVEKTESAIVVNTSPIADKIEYPEQKVVAFPNGIPAEKIIRANIVDKKGNVIKTIDNPNYKSQQ